MGKYSAKKEKHPSRLVSVLLAAALFLVGINILLFAFVFHGRQEAPQPAQSDLQVPVLTADTAPESSSAEAATQTEPEITQPQILPWLAEKAGQNPDMVGWISIAGTKIDYPIMHTPDDPEKYLHKDFQGNFSVGGLPFLDAACTLDSDNLLIYGHNMHNGTMFRNLLSYDQKNFWQEHPVISVSTLYEEKTYEILAALYDRVYLKSDTCFKFYQFIDAADQDSFDNAVSYFKEHALYDTGVTAHYGDRLVTLVTCAYHVDNGRFLVVAREITEPSTGS